MSSSFTNIPIDLTKEFEGHSIISNDEIPSVVSDAVHIHTDYDLDDLPPSPGEDWTRFVCISDTHTATFTVPEGDVLIHAGDLTGYGRQREYVKTLDWIASLPHRSKIIIAGNHDMSLDPTVYPDPEDAKAVAEARGLVAGAATRDAGIVYLESASYDFQAKDGGRMWSVFGSPWTPYFGGMAFNYRDFQAEDIVSAIPQTDILITHGPPHRIHDYTTRGVYAGCPALRRRVEKLRPRLHVFGHIHEARGATLQHWAPSANLPVVEAMTEHPNDTTAFVNPANYPLGPQGYDGYKRKFPGSKGWLPIIVDLRD